MTRSELEGLIFDKFGVTAEYPWERYPSYAVFRHKENRKWFAVIMTIPKARLGILSDGDIDVVNLKCGREIIDSMLSEGGVYPAYHMTKGQWVSALLDGCCSDENIEFILDVSHELTKKQKSR
ncbi:MAG: MmcQ/YjbR family DNA-binding protein [Clostridia bacterium]|nr:MmcQ/YjbR family DNA-binding protein [Clostridia bacterium]